MRAEGVLDYHDFQTAIKLVNRRSFGRRLYIQATRWGFRIFVLLFAVWFVTSMYPNNYSWSGFLGLMPLVLLGVVLEVVSWRAPQKAYRRMFANADPSKPVYIEMNEELVLSGIPGSSEGRYHWAVFNGFSENQHVAVLHLPGNRCLIIPKRDISADSWASMKALITQRVAEAK